jgi:hypothetical protein
MRGTNLVYLNLPGLSSIVEASIESTPLVTFSIVHAFTYLSFIDPLGFSFLATAVLFTEDASCELDSSTRSGEPPEEYSSSSSEERWQWL